MIPHMPKIFRSMLEDGGKPKVGPEGKMLGVRVATDISADPGGNVHPNAGGMSVAPEWRKLPWLLIPKRLDPRGRGAGGLVCWRLGEGEFVEEKINDDLQLRLDPGQLEKHGLVEPTRAISLTDYQSALAATRNEWGRDEN
jgi:hypothetical protein